MTKWRPFSARSGKSRPEFQGPVQGAPPYMMQALGDWLAKFYFFTDDQDLLTRRRLINPEAVKSAGVRLRVPLDWSVGAQSAHESLLHQCSGDGNLFLDLIDFVLHEIASDVAAAELDQLLVDGGSAYEVALDGRGLADRVPSAVRAAAEDAVGPRDRAADLLAESWNHIFGRRPNPSAGYREAVRAVEAVACPSVIPDNKIATLGKAINRLRDAPAKFRIALQPAGSDPVALVRGMMELLWKSQLDRHGTADEETPLHVSQEEAEAALHVAITLVQWFRRGFVRLSDAQH